MCNDTDLTFRRIKGHFHFTLHRIYWLKFIHKRGYVMARSKIGVYWGTFDPPTQAHFNIMQNAIIQGKLDKLIVVINDNTGPKHYYTPGYDRATMIRKMLWNSDTKSPIELMKKNHIEIIVQTDDYKVDTKLIEKMNKDAWVVPVVGQDSFVSSAKYCKAYEEVIVAPRGEDKEELVRTMKEHDLHNIRVLELGSTFLTVSSTEVRSIVNKTPDSMDPKIADLVAPSTARYIRDNYFFKNKYHAEHHRAALLIQKTWHHHQSTVKEKSVAEISELSVESKLTGS